jgi:hypothetical protein
MSKTSLPQIPAELAALLVDVTAEMQRLGRSMFWEKTWELYRRSEEFPLYLRKSIVNSVPIRYGHADDTKILQSIRSPERFGLAEGIQAPARQRCGHSLCEEEGGSITWPRSSRVSGQNRA